MEGNETTALAKIGDQEFALLKTDAYWRTSPMMSCATMASGEPIPGRMWHLTD